MASLAEGRRHSLELFAEPGAELCDRGQEVRVRDTRADERPAQCLQLRRAEPGAFIGGPLTPRRALEAFEVEAVSMSSAAVAAAISSTISVSSFVCCASSSQ
jgi:hypothetical protein